MDLAGDLITDLCEFLGVDELESTASFPLAMEQFSQLLSVYSDQVFVSY